jgi:hypothetical protein
LNQNATNFKKKRKYKNQTRSVEGKYESKKVYQHNIIIDNYSSGSLDMIEHGEHGEEVNCENYDELNFFDSGDSELDVNNESGWDYMDDAEEEIKINRKLKELKLEWKENAQLEKIKRGSYMKGKTPKSTYYDKYGPSGSFTKAAADNEKITSFFEVHEAQIKDPKLFKFNETEEVSSDSEEEKGNFNIHLIKEKIKELKEQLEKKHNQMNIIEYNQKRAIYEYLVLLDGKGCGKISASLEVAKKVFIDAVHGKHKRLDILQIIGYLIINFQHLDMANIKNLLD